MNIDKTHGRSAAACLSAALLAAACGGGGGGGSSAVTEAPRVQITADNAPDVAAQAIDAGGAGAVGGFGSLGGLTASVPKTVSSALGRATKRALSARALATATGSFSCSGGGTIAYSVTVANPNASAPAPGDTMSLTFNACKEGLATASGAFSLTFVQADAALTYIVADATLSGFTINVGNVAERAGGTIRLAVDDRNVDASTVDVTSSAFSFERLVGGATRATRTLLNYVYHETSTAAGQSTETFSYTVTGSFPRLGEVSWQAATTAPIVTPAGALHPISGAGTVTGGSGRSVAITVIDTGLTLAIDSDGDGAVNVTRTLTWAEVDPLL